jgi:hypothetical protein
MSVFLFSQYFGNGDLYPYGHNLYHGIILLVCINFEIEKEVKMMKFKKFFMSLVLAFVVVISVYGEASAGTGDWDYQGSDEFTDESEIFLSGGGDFKVCLSSDSQPGDYQLYEEDPYNPDDIVYTNDGTKSISIPSGNDFQFGCYVYKNISGYVDGDQAEFYLKKFSDGNSTVHAYD